jgi:trigger factor
MQSQIKKLPQSEVELTCTIEPQEFSRFLTEAIRSFSQEIEVPGFRKGKAPESLVVERAGKMKIYEEAARRAISHFYVQCANEHQVDPLGQPQVSITKLAPENPFEFTIRVAVLPEVKLPDYHQLLKSLTNDRRLVKITDKQVEDSLVWLRRSRLTLVERVGPSQNNDHLELDFTMTNNGVLVKDGEQKDFTVLLGQHRAVAGFEEKLLGKAKGEKAEFDLEIEPDYWNKTIAGKTIHFSVLVKEGKQEVLPELNDAFAQAVGKFQSLAELRQSIKKGLEFEEQEKEQQRFRLRLLKEIDSQTICDPPEILINGELEALQDRVKHSIEATGISWQDYLGQIQKTSEALRQEFLPQAKERVRLALIIEAIAKKEKIEVSDKEVEAEANKYLAQYQSLASVKNRLDPETITAQTRDILKNEKVSQFLESLVPQAPAK